MRTSIVPVTGKHQLFAITGEHRKGIKYIVKSDLFQPGPIQIDAEEIEFRPAAFR